jgi:ADP-ribose pyrophosphatase YjhB (NUDIX family)
MRIIVTGGAVIRDQLGRILFQRRSDYGNWGLPGGGMNPGESVEETMKREILEETGLIVTQSELYAVYSGSRMKYRYPDGNEVAFVMFVFNATVELEGKLKNDGKTIRYLDNNGESLELQFIGLDKIDIESISSVQQPLLNDLRNGLKTILRT